MIMWKATTPVDRATAAFGRWAPARGKARFRCTRPKGPQLETDYYVHNEFLQLVAEYGLVGWLFLLALAAYLLAAFWRTLLGKGAAGTGRGSPGARCSCAACCPCWS